VVGLAARLAVKLAAGYIGGAVGVTNCARALWAVFVLPMV